MSEQDDDFYCIYSWTFKLNYYHYYRTTWSTLEMAIQEAENLALYLNLKGHGYLARKDLSWFTSDNREIIRIEKENFYQYGVDKDFNTTCLPKNWTHGIEKLYEPGGSMFIHCQENIKNLVG